VQGDDWVVGGGDPLLSTAPYTAHFEHQPQIATPLESLADAIVKAGISRVRGRILGDESRYDSERYPIATSQISHQARATKKKDATKIGVGAGVGAAVGALLGGGGGAAKGAAIGGAAGTGAVLATRGEEVRLGPGADVTTKLTAPLTVRVKI
jgi:hypothetical protein